MAPRSLSCQHLLLKRLLPYQLTPYSQRNVIFHGQCLNLDTTIKFFFIKAYKTKENFEKNPHLHLLNKIEHKNHKSKIGPS